MCGSNGDTRKFVELSNGEMTRSNFWNQSRGLSMRSHGTTRHVSSAVQVPRNDGKLQRNLKRMNSCDQLKILCLKIMIFIRAVVTGYIPSNWDH
jgi:hypothetical protein